VTLKIPTRRDFQNKQKIDSYLTTKLADNYYDPARCAAAPFIASIVYLRFEKLNFGSAGELAIDIKTIIYYGQCPALHRRALVYDAISPRNTPYFTNIYMKVRQLRFQHIPATNLFIINILTEIVAKY
jgi:hypothetical protein